MPPRRSFVKAFTLVEVLVVVAIISIFSAITMASLANSRVQSDVRSASQQMAAALREAQNYALSGRSSSLAEKNCWYGIEFTNATTYRVIRQPKDAAGNCVAARVVTTTYTFQNGVQVGGIPFPYIVGFLLPRAETVAGSPTPGAFGASIMLSLTKASVTYYVCVDPSGRVRERATTATCP